MEKNKQEIKEEYTIWNILGIVLIFILLGFVIGYLIFNGNKQNNCFKEIAEDHCESEDLELSNHNSNMVDGYAFHCRKELVKTRQSNRNYNYTKYYYLQEEIDKCI